MYHFAFKSPSTKVEIFLVNCGFAGVQIKKHLKLLFEMLDVSDDKSNYLCDSVFSL